ncbi:MAG: aminomethyl-transferring glycine dehydrogenase subunit GcvPA [Gammaproteobacteria bacterium]|nr:aminomethyl-transferring glycine dehydrogenase subunit GcvPA [Gammaproteobacteria bacterium]MBT8109125.1 aminomethyl-transferring glycine dehydrogenase subunit GcvPA [Gammaproteobacteria bacterium]NND48215.1 aminomethyl-transferring glycine dehydrogenase subunit GcvPA [Woeseiaceae bacterium]NNL43828.1 aminomethyl-transferring glycine dehydrogenase subunit GcvPA [Woeseiaceae bacterium]
MPFIPHTEKDTQEMLATIGVDSIEDLFDEIPAKLRIDSLRGVPDAQSEMEISRLMRQRAEMDGSPLCFIGAGAYEHHIPAAVWDIATRGEFYSAYTPYQAEASQGTLQTIYEYQSMITQLTGLDVSNASLYDGASALAEAALMAVRTNRRVKTGLVLLAPGVNPVYEQVAASIAGSQGLTFERLPVDSASGNVAFEQLRDGDDPVAVVVQQPSFPGTLEDVDRLTDWAHAKNAILIGIVNPVSLALLKAPGHWGEQGADIAIGEGQPLGVPMSSGGPYFGFMTCKQIHVRQMPGRIVGRTTDLDGKPGFALTLQAREQHIRRTKATSNICTNQGLMVTAATIYMSLLGLDGIAAVARSSHASTTRLVDGLCGINGVQRLYEGPYFHEAALKLDRPVAPLLAALAERDILGGFDLTGFAGTDALLVCATETKSAADIDAYVSALAEVMA